MDKFNFNKATLSEREFLRTTNGDKHILNITNKSGDVFNRRINILPTIEKYKDNKKHNKTVVNNQKKSFYNTVNTTNLLTETSAFNNTLGSINNNMFSCLENLDGEIENLKQYYYETGKNYSQPNKSHKNEIFNKYQISKKVTDEEKNKIKNVLQTSTDFKLNLNTSNSLMNKTIVRSGVDDFNNPVKSLSKLKINKQIHDNIVNMLSHQQIVYYMSKYDEVNKTKMIQSRMPEVRISATMISKLREKLKQHNDEENKTNRNEKEKEIEVKLAAKPINLSSKMANKVSPHHLSRDIIISNLDFEGYYIRYSKYKPSSRCQATLTLKNDTLYLIGGYNTDRLIDFWTCDLKNNNFNWNKVVPLGDIPLPRMGHTAVLYKSDIFIFGGNVEHEAFMPKDDITIYNTNTNRIYLEKCYNKGDLKWRRNHIAELVGYHMFIHGGVDEDGEFLSDSYLLDLSSLRWSKVEPKGTYKPQPVAFHSSCVVIPIDKREHSHFNIYRLPETSKISMKKIKNEGVYVFGGIDKEGNCNNELKVLKVGRKPLEWHKLETEGKEPYPRYNTFMSFYEELEIILVYGGRNDKFTQNVFNDVYVLDLHTLNWMRVNVFNQVPKQRSEHSMIINNTKMIVFGGTNTERFIGSDIYLLNLDYFENKKNKVEYNYTKFLNNDNEPKEETFRPPKKIKINIPNYNEITEIREESPSINSRNSYRSTKFSPTIKHNLVSNIKNDGFTLNYIENKV